MGRDGVWDTGYGMRDLGCGIRDLGFVICYLIFASMRYMKWIGLAVAALLVVSCFMTWVFIEERNISVSGIKAEGTNFGKPAYFHFIMTGLFVVFSFIPRIWARQWNLLFTALNLAWAVRNFFKISACEGGDCPEREIGIYLMLAASILMLVAALFPDMKASPSPPKEGF